MNYLGCGIKKGRGGAEITLLLVMAFFEGTFILHQFQKSCQCQHLEVGCMSRICKSLKGPFGLDNMTFFLGEIGRSVDRNNPPQKHIQTSSLGNQSPDAPWKINMEPKNHLFVKENHLNQTSIIMFHVNLRGCNIKFCQLTVA